MLLEGIKCAEYELDKNVLSISLSRAAKTLSFSISM